MQPESTTPWGEGSELVLKYADALGLSNERAMELVFTEDLGDEDPTEVFLGPTLHAACWLHLSHEPKATISASIFRLLDIVVDTSVHLPPANTIQLARWIVGSLVNIDSLMNFKLMTTQTCRGGNQQAALLVSADECCRHPLLEQLVSNISEVPCMTCMQLMCQ